VHIGLFGGSFDPPHICHSLLCFYVLEMTDVDKVLWVPCVDHAFAKVSASFEHRLAMSRLAAQALGPRVEISDIEKMLPRPSYTINTVEALRRQMAGARISVLIGSDIVAELERWQRIEDLRQQADFIIVPRGGYVSGDDETAVALPRLSSTDIRNALRSGHSVDGFVTPAVRAYIEHHGLYREREKGQ